MLCPEGIQYTNETIIKDEEEKSKKNKKISVEGTSSMELNSYKHPKNWKKSITNFFRNQLRSSKSNDGDQSSGSKEHFDKKELSPEQKWQSLGKVFRRQSFVDQWQKSQNQHGESSSQSKRQAVRKVLSTYFGKSPNTYFGKSPKTSAEVNEN